jgi:hypothetical protein
MKKAKMFGMGMKKVAKKVKKLKKVAKKVKKFALNKSI